MLRFDYRGTLQILITHYNFALRDSHSQRIAIFMFTYSKCYLGWGWTIGWPSDAASPEPKLYRLTICIIDPRAAGYLCASSAIHPMHHEWVA